LYSEMYSYQLEKTPVFECSLYAATRLPVIIRGLRPSRKSASG